jgi:hypothetical protein
MPIEIVAKTPSQQAPTKTETHEPSASAPPAPTPIEATGPATDTSRIRRALADLMSPVSRLFENPTTSDQSLQASAASPTTDSFLSKCIKFYDRMSRGFWGLVENITDFTKWLLERAQALQNANNSHQPTSTSPTNHPSDNTHPTQLDQGAHRLRRTDDVLSEEHKKKPQDAVCGIVGEAARREDQRQKARQFEERARQQHLRHDAVDQIHEIDARNGVTNENAEIIINNMLSGWTSVSAALNQILSAQTGEILPTKKKVS